MTSAHTQIAARIALIGTCLMPAAQALTLGDVELQSYVGQPFRAAVPYKTHAGEALNPDCVRLTLGSGDLPSLGSASLTLSSRGEQSGVLYISSRQSIGEPIVGFGIQVECNGLQLSRSFTAFLNVAPAEEPKPAPILSVAKPNSTGSRGVEDVPNRDPDTITVKKTTTLAEITKRYYPENTPQYPRFLNKLISVNPGLEQNTPIAAGSKVIIPDLLRSPKKAPVKASKQESGLLRLDGEAMTSAPKPKAVASSSAEYTRQLEQKLVELNDLQQKMQLEITQLNLQLAQMNASAVSRAASAPIAAISSANPLRVASAASHLAAPAARAIASPVEIVESPEGLGIGLWAALLAGGAAILGGAWWILARRRTNTADKALYTEHDESQFGPNPSYYGPAPAGFASDNTMMSALHLGHAARGIEVEHEEEGLANDMARAQILIAQGETMDAIDILYRCIDEAPQDIERWLMLFRLFRQQGMKTEYAQLAQNLKMTEPDPADWELVRNIGARLDPENPLYLRDIQTQHQAELSASYAQALGINPEPIAKDLQLDLEAPSSPDLGMMTSLKQDHGIPPQFSSLQIQFETPKVDHSIDLPDLNADHLPDLSQLEKAAHNFEVEELNLKPVAEAQDEHLIEFDIAPLELPKDAER